jgi:hypothetical protein
MKLKTKFLLLASFAIIAVVFLFTAFRFSENITHYHNSFVRRFPQHYATEVSRKDLKFNSYYFAGSDVGKIYLGNITTPLQVMEIDEKLNKSTLHKITLDVKSLPFRSPQVKVLGKYFFVFEGAVPYIFKGNTADWKAKLVLQTGAHFSQLQPIDSTTVAARFISQPSGESIIGTIDLQDTLNLKTNKLLLQKQIDGIFDTDGYFFYNQEIKKLLYLYMYRNQYTVANPDLSLDFRGNTIDTISKAQVKIAKIESKGMRTFSAPPLTVNRGSATYGNRLYVDSALPGLYEEESVWKNAQIIDMYDLQDKAYLSSFYIYHINGKKLRSFIVSENFLFALIGDEIIKYKFRPDKKLIREDKQ